MSGLFDHLKKKVSGILDPRIPSFRNSGHCLSVVCFRYQTPSFLSYQSVTQPHQLLQPRHSQYSETLAIVRMQLHQKQHSGPATNNDSCLVTVTCQYWESLYSAYLWNPKPIKEVVLPLLLLRHVSCINFKWLYWGQNKFWSKKCTFPIFEFFYINFKWLQSFVYVGCYFFGGQKYCWS